MNNNEALDLKKMLEQIKKYNKDFKHYLTCLTTLNNELNELKFYYKRVANIKTDKKRSQKATAHIKRMLIEAIKNNFAITKALETEIGNLTKIVSYIKQQKPKFEQAINNFVYTNGKLSTNSNGKDAIKLVTEYKKLKNNLDLCFNYVLPKNQAILKERQVLQTRLTQKQQMLNQINFATNTVNQM